MFAWTPKRDCLHSVGETIALQRALVGGIMMLPPSPSPSPSPRAPFTRQTRATKDDLSAVCAIKRWGNPGFTLAASGKIPWQSANMQPRFGFNVQIENIGEYRLETPALHLLEIHVGCNIPCLACTLHARCAYSVRGVGILLERIFGQRLDSEV